MISADPPTPREFELIAGEVRRVGAEVDEVREAQEHESTRLDARIDEHSDKRDAMRADIADLKTQILLQGQTLSAARKLGWAVFFALIAVAVTGAVQGAVWLVRHVT